MAEKILSIKLNIDTSQGGKLFEVIKSVDSATDKLASTTNKLTGIERQRADILKNIGSEYSRLNQIASNASEVIASKTRGWNIAERNVQSAVEATTRRMQEQLNVLQGLRNAQNLGANSAIARPEAYGASEARQATLLATRVAREQKATDEIAAYAENRARTVEAFRQSLTTSSDAIINGQHRQAINIREEQERQAAIRAQSFAQRMNSQPRVSGQGSQIDITGILTRGLQAQTAAATANTAALSSNAIATNEATRAHRNMFIWIAEVIGIYRAYNLILNTFVNSMKAIPKIGIELESTIASLTATTNSAAGMGSVMTALRGEADRTGISITTLRETFRGFQASTSLAGESIDSTWRMFTNLDTVITGLHLPAEKASGIFLAMAQIFNKTKVQSEELVKQLGNLIPGAFASFAAANNVDTVINGEKGIFKNSADLIAQMKKGVVFAHETVERFTQFLAERFAPSFALASQGLNANIGRMQTSFTLLGEAIYNMSSGAMVSVVRGITSFVKYLEDGATGANNLGKYITTGLNVALASLVGYLYNATAGAIAASGAMSALTGTATLATRSMVAFEASLAFISKPAVLVAGFVAVGMELAKFGKSVDDVQTRARERIDTVVKAIEDAKRSNAATPLKIQVEEDPSVKGTKKDLDDLVAAAKIVEDKLSGKKFALGDDIISLRKQQGENVVLINQLSGLLFKLRKDAEAKIKLTLDGGDFTRDLSDIREKVKLLYLTATGQTEARGKLQFDITNREMKSSLDKQIEYAKKNVDEWNKELARIKVSPQTDENIGRELFLKGKLEDYKKNVEALNEYNIAQANAGVEGIKAAGTIVTSISKTAIRSIESEAKLALERLKTEQEAIDNKVRLRQLSFNDAYKERLRISKEILTVELNKANKEIAATSGKSTLQEQSTGSTSRFNAAIEKYSDSIVKAADKWKVPADYIKAVMSKESGGVLGAININKGGISRDLGLMQVNTKAHPEFEQSKLLTNAAYNIDAGTKILAESLRAFPNDLVKGFTAYNAGIGGAAKGTNVPYGEDVAKRATGSSNRQIAQNVKDSVDINVQADAIERAYEADKQRVQEADKLLQVNKEELTTLSNIVEVDFLRASGLKEQADVLELNNKYRVNEELLAINGLETERKKVVFIKSQEVLQLSLNKLSERRVAAEQFYQNKVEEVQTLLAAGVLSQREATNLLNDSKKETLRLQDLEIEKLREQIKLSGGKNIEAQDKLNAIQQSKNMQYAQSIGGLSSTIQSGMPSELNFLGQNATNQAKNEEQLRTGMAAIDSLRLTNHEEWLAKKAALDDKYNTATQVTAINLYSGMAGVATTGLESIAKSTAAMYGNNSKQARAAFIAYKAMAVAQAVMTTATAVMSAYDSGAKVPLVGPVTTGPAYAAMAAAIGAVQIATIIAQPMPQAHGGLDYVPENNKTYLLSKGERVLQPNANKDLTKALQNGTLNQSKQPVINNNNKIINVLDPSIVGDYLSTTEGENIIMNVVSRNQAA